MKNKDETIALEGVGSTVGLDRSNRCSDFDSDCAYVENKFRCFNGALTIDDDGVFWFTDIADGYCPYLVGMRSNV